MMKKRICSWNRFEIPGFTLLELTLSLAIASLLLLVIGSLLKSTLSFGTVFPRAIARAEDVDFIARTMRDEILGADEILSLSEGEIQLYLYDESLIHSADGPHTYIAYKNGDRGINRMGRHGKNKVAADQWKGKRGTVTNLALKKGKFTCREEAGLITLTVTLGGESREVIMATRGRDE